MVQTSFKTIALIPLLLALPALAMVVIGLRGRREGDHPFCRRCGFDLFGLPPESKACSECGADVSERRAVRVGRRRARRGLLIGGTALLLPALLMLGAIGWAASRQVALNELKPVWWLLLDTDSSSATTRSAALAELARRAGRRELSDSQVVALVDRALKVQADATRPWVPAWGDLIQQAQAAGKVPAEKWKQYLGVAAEGLQLRTRTHVRRGAVLPVQIKNGPVRVGSQCNIWVNYSYAGIEIDGKPSDSRNRGSAGTTLSSSGSGSTSWTIAPEDAILKALEPGEHTLKLKLDVKLYNSHPQGNATPVVARPVELQTRWMLIDGPTVALNNDLSLRAAVEKALSAKRQQWNTRSDYLDISVDAKAPPVPLAFEVIAVQGPKQWSIGKISFLAGGSSHSWGIGGAAPGFVENEPVDLLLRPSLEAAEQSIELTELWNGEILLKDVKKER